MLLLVGLVAEPDREVNEDAVRLLLLLLLAFAAASVFA